MKLLVVDDDRDVLDALATLLKLAGHEVTKARNGNEGEFAFMNRGPFDFVLTDYSMPGQNGVELALNIRKREPGQKIVLISASHTLASTLPDYGLSDVPVLLKPCRLKDIELLLEGSVRVK